MEKTNYNLTKTILDNSVSNDWHIAVNEWEIIDQNEDEEMNSECICGKEGLRYLFTIKNIKNNNILSPIGSKCIKKFGVKDLTSEVNAKEEMFKLMHAIENKKFIELNSEWFSKKLLAFFLKNGVFKANNYNNQNGENDYKFLLKMFNQRKDPTSKQQQKIKALIMNDILPYLKEQLAKQQEK